MSLSTEAVGKSYAPTVYAEAGQLHEAIERATGAQHVVN